MAQQASLSVATAPAHRSPALCSGPPRDTARTGASQEGRGWTRGRRPRRHAPLCVAMAPRALPRVRTAHPALRPDTTATGASRENGATTRGTPDERLGRPVSRLRPGWDGPVPEQLAATTRSPGRHDGAPRSSGRHGGDGKARRRRERRGRTFSRQFQAVTFPCLDVPQ